MLINVCLIKLVINLTQNNVSAPAWQIKSLPLDLQYSYTQSLNQRRHVKLKQANFPS